MKVNNISLYTHNKTQKLSSNKANYATNPFNSTSKSRLKQDEISFTAKGMDRLIQGKLQDYFTAEAQDIYNTAETIAINTNSEKIEMWHLYYASLLALQATLDDIESGRITPETAENRNTLYQTVATLAGVDEDEFKEENIRKIVIDVVNKHIKLAQEAYFPKATENEEKRQLTFNLGKKQINIPLLTPKKIVRPKLSDDARSELIGLFSKLGNANGESVFLDGYYLNSALNYPDKKMTKVATDFMHDLKERIAVKSDENDKKPLGFYNNYADIVEKNINIGNDVLVTYNVDNVDGRDNLISSIAAKYKDSETEVITLNDYADFEFFNHYTRKMAKDKTKKKIIIADFSSMGVRTRKSKGSFILNQNELATINNSTKDKKNPNLRIVLTMPLEAYIANNANPMIKDVFKTYNNLSLPTMNIDEAKKYLTDKDGLEYLKEAVGVDLSGQVVEKAIELTAQDKGFYPVKIVDLLSGLVRYNIDKKELTPELLEQYVKENTALGKTKDTDEQSFQIDLNTESKLSDIMGTPMTKAEALNIVNQIKKGTFKTKGYTIYQANGSSYGGHTVEKLLYNQNGSWGISCDIENITETATQAVLHLGMGPKTGTRKILFGPNGDLIASDKKKLEIEEDIDYLCHTAKEVSEMIIKAYQPFIKQFSDEYYSKVGSGDCLITKEQFVKELNEWINSLTDEEKAELKQIKHRCAQKIKRVEEDQAKLSKDC